MIKKIASGILAASISLVSYEANAFIVRNIQINGLTGIDRSTVLSYLPIKIGDDVTSADTANIISSLYQTGFFSDVSLAQSGNTLIINVSERATIGIINISGNKLIKSDDLKKALKENGIAEGLAFDQSTVTGMQRALEQEYIKQGRYTASVNIDVTKLPRNRVELDIKIDEGKVAKVKSIQIVGNRAFSEKQLRKQFQLTTPKLWSFISKGDEYNQDKLDKDLKSLASFYMDRGYLKFKIDSVNPEFTPDKKNVNIVIKITEGPIYKISGFRVTGNTLGKTAQVEKLITIKSGETFNRQKTININNRIGRFYSDQGYAQAQVNIEPSINDSNDTVFLDFNVQPGPLVYVRQINFTGNTRTADYVLRREMRQSEGGVYSQSNIQESTRRLNNLGYLENVKSSTTPVPGKPNQIDLNYDVSETSSAYANASLGYTDAYGFIYGASIVENNFKGSGRTVGLSFNNSQYQQLYSFNYFNPYYTTSGISRGFTLNYAKTTPAEYNGTAYRSNTFGGTFYYRIPLSEYNYFNFGYGYQYYSLSSTSSSEQINNFLSTYGSHFNETSINFGFSRNSLDRAIFPTLGSLQNIGSVVGVPLLPENLAYYTVSYNGSYYHPLFGSGDDFVGFVRGTVGYGNGYARFDELPFFKNFYAGGLGSVRGYAPGSLGPQDNLGNPLGGNVLTTGSVNFAFPNFITKKIRTSLFVDAGNVYEDQLQFGELRYSTGLEVDWASPLGTLQFSLAKALNPKPGDDLQFFNFSVGTSF